jgi:hypothetical protein
MPSPRAEHQREMARWNLNDIKGSHKTLYTKSVHSQNQDIMTIVKQSNLDEVHNYTDRYCCLPTRKKIMKYRVYVTNCAIIITTNRFFEAFIILIIGMNSVTLAQSDSTVEETPA